MSLILLNKINGRQKRELGPSEGRPHPQGPLGVRGGTGRDVKYGVSKHEDQKKLIKIMEHENVKQEPLQPQRRRHHFDYDYLPMENGVVPEEFLRRFTDTDSRPMTPTPTVLSNKTHSSSMARPSRRCVTPEPQNVYETEKKRIILDLRRSQSQETLYWNASSEFSVSAYHEFSGSVIGSCRRPKTTSMAKEVIMGGCKPRITKRNESSSAPGGQSLTLVSGIKQQGRGASAKSQEDTEKKEVAEAGETEEQRDQMQKQLSCIYSKDDLDEEPRRRGKKKKRGKPVQQTSTFRPSQDPETQVANVPPDSTAQSQRPSIVANGAIGSVLDQGDRQRIFRSSKGSCDDFREALDKKSFLDESLLSQLRRGLSIETIETNFHVMVS